MKNAILFGGGLALIGFAVMILGMLAYRLDPIWMLTSQYEMVVQLIVVGFCGSLFVVGYCSGLLYDTGDC